MELRWLDDFCALARTRHFSRAADERHVSQPTFSRRIKLLEEEVGVQLIDRNCLPLQLTAAGEVFLRSCEQVSTQLRQTKSECIAIDQQQKAQIKLATSQSLLLSFLPTWRQELQKALAGEDHLTIDLAACNWLGNEYSQALLQGKCDLLLIYWHADMLLDAELSEQEVEYVTLGHDVLLPMSAGGANGTILFTLKAKAAGSQQSYIPYIAYHPQTLLAQVIASQVEPDFPSQLVAVNENSQAVNSKALIQQGFGLGWVPQSLAQTELDQGLLHISGDQAWHIDLQIRVYRRRNNANIKLAHLWQSLQASNGTE